MWHEDIIPGGLIPTPSNAVDPPPTIAVASLHMAGEIGPLSRDIYFENIEDSMAGPSSVILRTHVVPQ